MLNIIEHIGKRGARCCCVVCRKPFEVLDRFIAKSAHAGDQCDLCKNLPSNAPTQALLHQLYNYDWDTGKLTYKRDFARRYKGEDPTSTHTNNYLAVTLDKSYLAHRMIWLMQTGELPEFVDHENHDRTDNSWANLRDVDRQTNAVNKSLNVNNKSGYIGVSFMPKLNKFRAYITVDRRSIHLGMFDTAEAAYQARLLSELQNNFHSNHGK